MKKLHLICCMLSLAAVTASAATATVREVRPGVRPVYNSGTGVMPKGAQEAMPKAQRQLDRDNTVGVGFWPVQFSLVTPVQFPPADYDIGGLRLSLLYGTCCNFDGLDLGLVGVSENHANGWLADVVNIAYGDGLGLHTGVVNYLGGDFKGWQIGAANWIGSGDSLQIGAFNGAYDMQGVQIGVINTVQRMRGVQIGLVNIISNSDVPFMPIFNCYF